MAKIKLPSKPPRIDMTPMVDLFFLLLTFFMLTTSFKPQEAVQVDTPKSISEKVSPDKNLITIALSKNNKVFFNIDNGKDSTQHIRRKLLKAMGDYYGLKFPPEMLSKFEKMSSFGMPIKDIDKWIEAEPSKRDAFQTGIPMDSTDNQLNMWVRFARQLNPLADAAIKGDDKADYKVAKKVFDVLQANNINRFNLTTTLEKVEAKLEQ